MKETTTLCMRKQNLKGACQEDGDGKSDVGLHMGGLFQFKFKGRNVNGALLVLFLLIVSVVILVLGDDLTVVQQVGLRISSRDDELVSAAEPNGVPVNAIGNGQRISLLMGDYSYSLRNDKARENQELETSSPDADQWGDHSGSAEEQTNRTVPSNQPNVEKTNDGLQWVEFPYVTENETEVIWGAIRENGTLECHNVRTKTGRIVGLPGVQLSQKEEAGDGANGGSIRLEAGPVYEFQIVSVDEDDRPRCQGGDYYETDLSGPTWKSRPPIVDHQNGTYTVRLQMEPRFAGVYELRIILMFSNFHGFHKRPERWARIEEVAVIRVEFTVPESSVGSIPPVLPLPKCERKHFVDRKYWSGRWTREKYTEDCDYSRYGRWICVNESLPCQAPWCDGTVGTLESNGWVYSAHCAFKIFTKEEAWKCLDKKWLFFWGDSNHIDTIRNLLNFVLGFDHSVKFLDRRMDETFYAPGSDNATYVRITSMFNGHSNVTKNYEGLFSIHNKEFADQCRSYFTGETAPDFMFMNSGLHDGVFWRDMGDFLTRGVDYTIDFWTNIWNNMKARRPDVLYRTTVTTGGKARNESYNPQKMEWMNHVIVDRLSSLNLERFQIIDGFDYTYPWHYDHKTNDGVHYGRPPSKSKWAGGNLGHRYFVDLMLVHMLLNAIC
ncbi:hypothetical protein R1sor_006080 [Riccia sorocarpa]|uniref:Uncharacterized protein n=1 Tax=Riccia sorocarpa TaxID=122646 RepID=A0ABD3HQ22_9MARC